MAGLRLAVLISGQGSNLQALIDATQRAGFGAEIVIVISNQPNAYGLGRARKAGLSTKLIEHRAFASRDAFDDAIDGALRDARVDLVCLAGFMRVLGDAFVERWRDRLINIHPSLLPAFKGLDVHARVLAAGARISGCTVHYVRPEVDAGPIIVQAAVPVLPDDTVDALQARVHRVEHVIYPLAVELIAKGRVRIEGDLVRLSGVTTEDARLISPARPS
ncbi:MAG: phosphoribosylglycinamide formyltransferase [Alphaproteobacteria bacterium]|nr:phosphoribosylglycinamide formyltransferase [Alphaproteobacteria bacterium]